MSILKVARLGHPVIRAAAEPLTQAEIASAAVRQLIDDMIDTMREYEGVGIAAPQVHVSKKIAVIEVRKNSRYPQAPDIPLTVLINPSIEKMSSAKLESWEGCLSIPDLRGVVPRAESLTVKAHDRQGKPFELSAEGFFARVIQHECDHLAGRVYLDRMRSLETLTHLTEYERYWSNI